MSPALSIILSSAGMWGLGMRALMVTNQGEDFMHLAEAKGLPESRIFFVYAFRNAMLPQITAVAISLGFVLSGSVLVEVIFNYPGVGFLLRQAISGKDFYKAALKRNYNIFVLLLNYQYDYDIYNQS